MLAFALFLAPIAPAQNTPHLGYVYPAGGRPASTFTVVVGGQFLSGITNFAVVVEGDWARAKIIGYERPLRPMEQQALKEELNKYQEKRKGGERLTAADLARLEEIRLKLLRFGRQPANPAISEFMTLQLTLATNALPGDHEIRVRTPGGLSNPLKFCVGLLPETTKPHWKAVPKERGSMNPAMPPPTEATVKLPATINGQILPGGVDRYRFWARRGQQLVIAVEARRLIPYLPDAVPGWFQAALSLYDAKGHELAYTDHFRYHPDPVIHYEIPKDGEYVIQIRDSIYRGREDFVYRITAGELPYVTDIFPLGGTVGADTSVELTGWNLLAKAPPDAESFVVPPSGGNVADATRDRVNAGQPTVVRQQVKFAVPGVYLISANNSKPASNLVPFAADTLPECAEQEPNDSPESAQPVKLPVIVNGRIDHPGDVDVFSFEGRAGEQIVAEVNARRLDSPLDSTLKLTDAAGEQLAFNDDYEDKGAGLDTHYADSYLKVTLPANGTYFLHLNDAQHQGGLEFAYRLRISPPRPDFALRVMPSSINIHAGASVPLTVFALRKDGFTNAITLELKNAPAGFSLSGAQVPANQDKARFTLTAPATQEQPNAAVNRSAGLSAQTAMYNLSLDGWAMINGQKVFHPAVPAEDMMQAFAYRHLVPAQSLTVAVAARGMPPLRILSATPVKLPAGGTVRVRVGPAGPRFTSNFQLELNEPPEGITIGEVSPTGAGAEIELRSDAAKAKPGLKGNLIISLVPATPAEAAQKGKAPGNQRRPSPGSLPAIPFEIVEPPTRP